jgi:hypothetical protein
MNSRRPRGERAIAEDIEYLEKRMVDMPQPPTAVAEGDPAVPFPRLTRRGHRGTDLRKSDRGLS